MTLKEQIRANRWRTLWLLVLFAALAGLLGAIGAVLYDPSILVVVAIVAFTYAIFSWFAAGRMVAGLTGAKPVERSQYPRLFHVLETVCIAAGIDEVPPVYVIDDPAPNAFAAGRSPKHRVRRGHHRPAPADGRARARRRPRPRDVARAEPRRPADDPGRRAILFWEFALVAGLLLTPQRRLLFTRWTVFGGLIAFALFVPFLLWNAANGWASLQYWTSYSANHGVAGTPIDFLANQILGMNPLSVPLWGAGLWYFFSKRSARYRVFGWAYLILFVLFIAIQGKTYFWRQPTAALCWWGDGGRAVAGALAPMGTRGIAAYAVALTLVAVLLAPAVMPVLPPAMYAQVYGTAGNGGSAAGVRRCLRLAASPGGSLRLGGTGRVDCAGLSQPASG